MLKDISNIAKGGYLLWVVANLTMALFNAGNMFGEGFEGYLFPFAETFKTSFDGKIYWYWWEVYDWTEFLFYLIVPVLLYFAYKLLQPQPKPSDHWKQYQKPKEEQADDVDPPNIDTGLPKY